MSKSDKRCNISTTLNSENTATSIIDNFITHQGTDASFLLATSAISQSNTTSDDGTAASLVVNNDSASREPHQDTGSSTPPMSTTNDSNDSTAASLVINNDSASRELEPHQDTASTTIESGMDVDAPPSATETTSNPVSEESGQEEITNLVAVAAPGWLSAINMDIYLQECSDAKEWQGLVQSLYKFEEGNTINGVRH